MKFKVGDIAIPKKEWLDPGEVAMPVVILDAWEDSSLHKEKIAVMSVEEAAKIKNGTLVGIPHSRMDTFADYYDMKKEFIE